jgi:hypothetical protein
MRKTEQKKWPAGWCDGKVRGVGNPKGLGIVEPSRAGILHARFGLPRFMPGGPVC